MQKNNRLLYFLAFVKFILPFILQNSVYEPHRDEFLYIAEAQHMAWGYMEVPPLLSVFAWLVNAFGDGMFWLKFWPSLFGAMNFILAGKIILSLGGKRFALWLGFFAFIFTVYLRVHFLFQPNFLEIFFWTLLAYSIIRYIQRGKNVWLYIFGISAGLGMLSKYSVAFFIVAVIIGLLLTKQRNILANKHFWIASFIGFLLFLPNVLWQLNHHLPVIHHMKLLQQTQLQFVTPLGFLLDQLLMLLPCVFIWLAGLWFVLFTIKGRPYRFLAGTYVTVIILLVVLHGKNYYALGVYPALIAFGAYHLENITEHHFRIWRIALIATPVVLGIFFMPVGLPVAKPETLAKYYQKSGLSETSLLKWEDLEQHPLPQDFSDMLGWKELAQKVSKVYHSLSDEDKKRTFIFCDNYGEAGAINYYRKKYDLPEVYSDDASFLYWIPRNIWITNMLLVTDDQEELEHPFIKDLQSAVLIDSIANTYARERGTLILYFKGANRNFNDMFKKKIDVDFKEIEER